MNKNDLIAIFSLVFFCIFMLLLIVCVSYFFKKLSYEDGYLDACKDLYQNKKLKYSLVKDIDGTVSWKKIEFKNGEKNATSNQMVRK